MMTNKLNESGWTDGLKHRSKGMCVRLPCSSIAHEITPTHTEKARNMDPLSFRALQEDLKSHVDSEF